MHYSISELPENGYKTRVADDRVGYFMTVLKDFSSEEDEHFIRYINRWKLGKSRPESQALAAQGTDRVLPGKDGADPLAALRAGGD